MNIGRGFVEKKNLSRTSMAKKKAKKTAKGQREVKQIKGPFVSRNPHPRHCEDVSSLMAMLRGLKTPTAIDLFCGAGGLSLGLQDAGFEVVLGVDHDRDAVETHASLCPGLSTTWDLADPEVVDTVAKIVKKGKITLVAGGPPCQPFSTAGRGLIRHLVEIGKRDRIDKRANLWESFLAVIEKSKPPAVLMENVPDIALDPTMGTLRTMVGRLEDLGYSVYTRLIETWRYGVPQFRERFFLIALKGHLQFEWPAESIERVTVDNAIGDLPPIDGGDRPDGGAEGWWDYGRPKTNFQKRARQNVKKRDRTKIQDHITRPVRPDDRKVFTMMDAKTRYTDIPAELRRYRDDIFTDKYKRLDAHDLSRTITAHISKDGYWYIHPTQHRTLTVREAARIQTFRDEVRFAGSPSSAFRQIGNAVPPLAGENLGKAILSALQKKKRAPKGTSTTELSQLIGAWFDNLQSPDTPDKLRHPWFVATSRWQALVAEQLLRGVRPEISSKAWPMLEQFETPELTLEGASDLLEIAGFVGRTSTAEELLETAWYFAQKPEALKSVPAMVEAPNVDAITAALSAWIMPEKERPPVTVGTVVLRVAARLVGNDVDSRNTRTDGRIVVARIIGIDNESREAMLGLVELGRAFCTPQEPRCHDCPLVSCCHIGSAHVRRRPMLF